MANPKTIISKMIEDFIRSSQGLLEITHQDFYFIEAENSLYGKVYAKPSQRFSTLLCVERELLILFTSFRSQQARTIKAIRALLAEAHWRLESTVVIVVHPDPTANNKLKIWGRGNGLSILPVYYDEDKFPLPSIEFESTLCRELFSHDPFDVTGPVSDDNQFYGRRTEAQDLARQLQAGQVKACLGIRKIGKTSILNRIVDICKNHYDCYVVVIDCSRDEVWSLNAATLMASIAFSLEQTMSMAEKYSALSIDSNDIDITKSTQMLISSINKNSLSTILVFDEIDYITPGSPTGKHWCNEFNIFWRNLRVVYQETLRMDKKFSLLLSGVSSKWFRVESIEGIENAALAFIPEEYLSPLPRGASIAMIKTLARIAGLLFDELNADLIAAICCDNPFWIRKACSFLHQRIDIQGRPVKPENSLIKSYLEDFVQTEGAIIAQLALGHLMRVYPELLPHAISCFQGKFNEIPKNYLAILTKYGLVKLTSQQYDISGTLMREGLSLILNERSSESLMVENVTTEPINKGRLDEWADELALINRRRNIIEKKMRGIVLNFLRFDSLQDKQKPSPQQRILKRIEDKRRKQFETIATDDLMDKLLWSELSVIIEKEWSLFERIFSDKTQFSLNSTIINDRFDAHAKEADAADLALYRRSLKWFEERVNSA